MSAPLLLALLVIGCKPPDPAPTELDDLVHFFLAQVDAQEHERIIEGADNLETWFEGSGLDGAPAGGTLSDLVTAELESLEELRWEPDPTACAGVYVVSELSCGFDDVVAMNMVEDQREVFPDNYAAYSRTWLTSPECLVSGTCDAVDWVATIDDSLAGGLAPMTYELVMQLRRTRDEDDQPAVILIRSIMPEPAAEDLDIGGFEQSYHIEAYVPRGSGTLHVYGLWNLGWILGSDPEASFWPNQYLDGLLAFESTLETVCVQGW